MQNKKIFAVVSALVLFVSIAGSGGFAHAQTADTQAPTTPGSPTTTAIPPSQVSLSWSGSTDNVAVAGYYVYRNGVSITSVNGTSFTDSGLTPGYYSYTVAAYDAAGNVSRQSAPAGITLTQDTTPPSVPGGLTVTPTTTYSSGSTTSVSLSWSASTDNVGVVGYYVYRDGMKLTSSTAITGTSYTDVLPSESWTYSYTVAAYDAAGNISGYSAPARAAVVYSTAQPSAPTHLSASQTGLTQVTLSWASSTGNLPIGGYYVYRNGLQIGTISSSPYVDTGVTAGFLDSYDVAAQDVAGNFSASSSPTSIAVVNDNGSPSFPTGLSATPGPSSILISWNPSTDAIAVAGYALYRNGSQIATVATTSYVDSSPVTGANIYSLTAYNLGGVTSTFSNTISVNWQAGMSAPTTTAVTPVTTVPQTPVVLAPSTPAQPSAPAAAAPSVGGSFDTTLYYGLRNPEVSALQSLLIAQGYLSSSATGFFGTLTLQALQKFQCDKGVACSGAPGWGIVGPKTRTVLNGLSSSSSVTSSNSSLQAELQMLEAQLQKLESQSQ